MTDVTLDYISRQLDRLADGVVAVEAGAKGMRSILRGMHAIARRLEENVHTLRDECKALAAEQFLQRQEIDRVEARIDEIVGRRQYRLPTPPPAPPP